MKTATGSLTAPGVWPVMITPFKADGQIDFQGLESLIDFYIAHGVSGLFACCLSSEIHELTPEETILLCSKTVEYARGRVPVAAGIPQHSDINELADFARQTIDAGACTVVITTCQIAGEKESDDIWKQRMQELMSSTGEISLGTYECPVPYKRVLSPELFRWIAESGRVHFHKDTCCDAEQIRQKLAVSAGTGLRFFNANLPTLVDSLKAGGDGYSGVDTNLLPELPVWLCENARTAAPEQIHTVEQFLIDALDTYGNCYPRSAKWFLKMRGVQMDTHCRRKNVPLCTEHDEQRLTALYRDYQNLAADLAPQKKPGPVAV
jgi:4-hydroxy-tetrahydrodipicolinate synthase